MGPYFSTMVFKGFLFFTRVFKRGNIGNPRFLFSLTFQLFCCLYQLFLPCRRSLTFWTFQLFRCAFQLLFPCFSPYVLDLSTVVWCFFVGIPLKGTVFFCLSLFCLSLWQPGSQRTLWIPIWKLTGLSHPFFLSRGSYPFVKAFQRGSHPFLMPFLKGILSVCLAF